MTDFSFEFVFASGEKHSPKAEPSEWLLRSDADTVADSLTVRFSAGKRLFTEEPVGAVLKKDGAVLFDGIVDEHRVKCQNGARMEVFFLRSRAALYGIRGTAFSRRLAELTDLLELGVIDGIIPEPEGGAHLAPAAHMRQVDRALSRCLAELSKESGAALAAGRYQKFRRMGAAPQKEEA